MLKNKKYKSYVCYRTCLMKQMKYRIYKRIAVLLVCRMKVHVGSEET